MARFSLLPKRKEFQHLLEIAGEQGTVQLREGLRVWQVRFAVEFDIRHLRRRFRLVGVLFEQLRREGRAR